MNSKRVYKCLSVAEKKQIIEAVERGEKKKNVAARFSIPLSTMTSILKKKDVLAACSSSSQWKRQRRCEHPHLEHCLLQWFNHCRLKNVPVGGPLLREKAKFCAQKLGIRDFVASSGWLDKFKKRHSIKFHKICSESAGVDQVISSEWKQKLMENISSYHPKNVFNADETGLFYKCVPDRALSLKLDKCHGGENSEERVTLLLCTNMDGSEKRKPLIIGKSAKPRCFKNIRSFPIMYRANTNAWMTIELFKEWLLDLNNDMMKQNRKILLLIDNCTAHNKIPELTNVSVQFLPPNTTSRLQPLEQGIIKNFKVFYRKEIVTRLLDCMDENRQHTVSILDAINITHKSWKNVSLATIRNCFAHCGFYREDEQLEADVTSEPSLHVPASDWFRALGEQGAGSLTFMDFVQIDDEVAISSTSVDDDILDLSQHVHGDLGSQDDDDGVDDDRPPRLISFRQAQSHIRELRYFLSTKDIDDSVFSAIVLVENTIDQARQNQ